jgi:hypothetical protein
MRTGYLDVHVVNRRKDIDRKHRFKQDDEFFNVNEGSSDRNFPLKDLEILRKEGLSNGLIMFDRKRTANIESGKYSKYYTELRKD